MPDAPGADVLVVVGRGTAASRWCEASDAVDRGGRGLRRDALARPRALRGRPGRGARRHAAGRGDRLVRRAGAARGRGGRRDRARARDERRLRQGALHVRPRDRLLPGGQARAGGDPAAARERPLAHVLHGLGGARTSRRSCRWRRPRSALVAGEAYDHAARAQISVHGGIGATWEHDAPLYFRRAQLAKRLLGGTGDAADRVADELFAQARAPRPRDRGRALAGHGPMRLWTHDRWRFPLPERHRFPIDKYALLRERVVADGTAAPTRCSRPSRSRGSGSRRVHDARAGRAHPRRRR